MRFIDFFQNTVQEVTDLVSAGLEIAEAIGPTLAFMAAIANGPTCGEDSDAVTYARSLSQERLSRLYYEMKAVPFFYPYELRSKKDDTWPWPFSDIIAARIRPMHDNIMLEGCFDHYVYLNFLAIHDDETGEQRKAIELQWGEPPFDSGSEIIWSK